MRTSFYDPSDSVIYRLDGTSPLFEYAMVRALSTALVDQQIAWSKDYDTLTDSQQVGLLALVNGVSEDVADSRIESERNSREAASLELISRWQAVGFNIDEAPAYVVIAMLRDELHASRYPVPPADDPLDGLVISSAMPLSDAVVFDVTRDLLTAPITVPPPGTSGLTPRTLGMQFWYEAMVPALGPEAARSAALLWAGDASVVTMVNNFAGINANIATASDADQAAMASALMQWGLSRPASSMAVVAGQPGHITSVAMCEPGEGGTDAVGGRAIMQLHSLASAEAEVARGLLTIGLPDTPTAWNCAVLARRSGALTDFQPDTVDPALISSMNDVVKFCSG